MFVQWLDDVMTNIHYKFSIDLFYENTPDVTSVNSCHLNIIMLFSPMAHFTRTIL